MEDQRFWEALDRLVAEHEVVIDRPGGSAHPRYPDFIYPFDYGYLSDTQAMDKGGIDVWRGSQHERGVTGIICTVDVLKQDAEIKILLGITLEEAQTILQLHNEGSQSAVLVARPGVMRPR